MQEFAHEHIYFTITKFQGVIFKLEGKRQLSLWPNSKNPGEYLRELLSLRRYHVPVT